MPPSLLDGLDAYQRSGDEAPNTLGEVTNGANGEKRASGWCRCDEARRIDERLIRDRCAHGDELFC